MPKVVDHTERRDRIADALIRVAGRNGLHAVTMRDVATEAGVSLRLVQYYFTSKAGLMQAALSRLERRSRERWARRLAEAGAPPSLRLFLEAFVAEALPTDEESRLFHLVWTSYAVLAMTDTAHAAQPFVEGPKRLERQLREALIKGRSDGELAADVDPAGEAAHLLALAHGLGTGVLIGQRTPEMAMTVFRHHLDTLFRGR